MLEGKELIVASNAYAEEKPWLSWWCVLSTLTFIAASMVGMYFSTNIWLTAGLSVLAGLLLTRMFVIYHDHQHVSILRGSKMGNMIMYVWGILTLAANSVWKASHNYHHQNNSKLRGAHIGSYPIMTRDKFLKKGKGARAKYLFMRHPLTIFFGYFFIFILGMCIVPFMKKPKEHYDCFLSLIAHIAINVLVVVFLGWWALLFMITIPFFIMSLIAAYFFYAQHNFPGVKFVRNADWTYAGAALNSTSYMKMSRIMHYFTANIGYHHVHHLNARIPFYRLPECMAGMEELQSPRCTSIMPWEIWRCLRLKVWDAKADELVPLSALKTETTAS